MAVAGANGQLPKFSRAFTTHPTGYEFLAMIVTSVRSCSADCTQSNRVGSSPSDGGGSSPRGAQPAAVATPPRRGPARRPQRARNGPPTPPPGSPSPPPAPPRGGQ